MIHDGWKRWCYEQNVLEKTTTLDEVNADGINQLSYRWKIKKSLMNQESLMDGASVILASKFLGTPVLNSMSIDCAMSLELSDKGCSLLFWVKKVCKMASI